MLAIVGIVPLAVAEQQQRERVQQGGGRDLAKEVHLEHAVPVPPQDQAGHREQVTRDQHDGQPERDDVTDRQADERGEDVEPVRRRVEHRAEPAGLAERTRELRRASR